MKLLDSEIKEVSVGDVTIEEAQINEEFVNSINYLIREGLIELEEDNDGEVRAYPVNE